MVWYIKVQAPTLPRPVIDRSKSGVYINEQLKPPGTYKLKPSDQVWPVVAAVNQGKTGQCRVRIVDVANNKVLSQLSKTVNSGETIVTGKPVTTQNMKIKLYADYWDGSKWITYDIYGIWDIAVEEAPPKPNPAIDKPRTYVVIGGQKKAPGTYTVKKGESIQVYATIVNQGGAGTCRVFVRDEKTGNIIADNQGKVDSNGYLGVSKTITVSSDLELKAYAAYWDGSKWIVVDEYGC